MNLFKWLKKIFTNRITLEDNDKSKLVSATSLNKSIKLGTKIEVDKNHIAIISVKNKIMDTFLEGVHKLEIRNLPILARELKLSKPNKKGEYPNSFKADIYYVSLEQFDDQKFPSIESICIKDKNFKKVYADIKGKFSYKIVRPIDFVDALFTQYGVVRNKIAKNELSYWVSTISSKKIQKNSPSLYQIYEKDSVCFEGLVDYLNKKLADVGVEIISVEITDVILPKNIYKKTQLSFEEIKQEKQVEYQDTEQIKDSEPEQIEIQNNANELSKEDVEQNIELQSGDKHIQNSNENDVETPNQTEYSNDLQEEFEGNQSETIDAEQVFQSEFESKENFEISKNSFDDKEKYDINDNTTNTENSNTENISDDEATSINNAELEKEDSFLESELDGSEEQTKDDEIDYEYYEPIKKTVEYKQCLRCGAFNAINSEKCFKCGNSLK